MHSVLEWKTCVFAGVSSANLAILTPFFLCFFADAELPLANPFFVVPFPRSASQTGRPMKSGYPPERPGRGSLSGQFAEKSGQPIDGDEDERKDPSGKG